MIAKNAGARAAEAIGADPGPGVAEHADATRGIAVHAPAAAVLREPTADARAARAVTGATHAGRIGARCG